MTAHLSNRRILLGISGGIAAYKSPELVRRLREAGAEVRVVMTRGAREFITPMTLQAVSGYPVRTDLWDSGAEAAMGHIELARWADDVLIAPASADMIARLAHGLADDLLTTLVLATEARLWLAPAMNRVMWASAAVGANCRTLTERGARLLGPGTGEQACGEHGEGRMSEPAEIVTALSDSGGKLKGSHVVITAGPTLEDLDPVRYLGNRSSGRMGFAIAAAAAAAGARVTLVAGPVGLATPPGVERVDVRSAEQMLETVMAHVDDCDVFIGVAAVADYRPAEPQGEKIKKTAETLELKLIRNPDILATVAGREKRPFMVGFAAETNDLETYARAKLEKKNLDLIAANLVGQGRCFDVSDNALDVFSRDDRWSFPCQDKHSLARSLIELIAECIEGKA